MKDGIVQSVLCLTVAQQLKDSKDDSTLSTVLADPIEVESTGQFR